jgi:hypothetical protein
MTERGRGDVMSYQVTALPNMQFVRSLSGRSGTALIPIQAAPVERWSSSSRICRFRKHRESYRRGRHLWRVISVAVGGAAVVLRRLEGVAWLDRLCQGGRRG